MGSLKKLNYKNLIKQTKKIDNPFSREIYISSINEEIGHGVLIQYDMGNGFAIFARSFYVHKDLTLIEESSVSAGVFIFNLGDELLFKYKDKKEHLLQKNYFLSALCSNEFYAEVSLEKNKYYNTVTIGVKNELFLHLTEPLKDMQTHLDKVQKDTYALIKNEKIDPRQLETLSYFKNKDSYKDILQNLFLESKVTDLSFYTINKIIHISKNIPSNLDENRIISLQKAKEVILKEYHKDLSIKNIAYKSTTNECYLKKDFKVYYGMTVFEMLQNHRMDRAKQYLQNNLSIKETALKVGYKHSGNFSKTFFKYFGITPNNYKKNFLDI